MFLALAICLVLLLPIGIVMAMTNLQISIYLISQIIAGVMFPGRGVANMVCFVLRGETARRSDGGGCWIISGEVSSRWLPRTILQTCFRV